MLDTSKGFTIVRIIDATAEDIWNAWTDPAEAAQWWHPRGLVTPVDTVSIDARVGGRYSYTMVDEDAGEQYPTGGEYRQVDQPRLLVFSWGDPDDEDPPLVSVRIDPDDELTRLTFDVCGVDGVSGDDSFYDGWDQALDGLVEHLGQTAVHG